jgi:hypothetical protein
VIENSRTPDRTELLDLYKIAVEEYRFQVKLNADRSRDYIVLNSAIIAAAVALIGQAHLPVLAAGAFGAGLVVSLLSIGGTHTQHGYYRDIKNRVADLEKRLNLRENTQIVGGDDLGLIRTSPSGSRYRRLTSVNFNYAILGQLCLVNSFGAGYSVWVGMHQVPPVAPYRAGGVSSQQKPATHQPLPRGAVPNQRAAPQRPSTPPIR